MKIKIVQAAFIGLMLLPFITIYPQEFIVDKKEPGSFPVVTSLQTTSIYVDINDYWLVQKAAQLLQHDIEMVTGKEPVIINTLPSSAQNIIIIGSAGRSPLIDRLIQQKKLNTGSIKNKWEGYCLQLISNPLKGIDNAFVITGSDRRGAAFGVFELSRQIGVSPWYWWADVPVKKKSELYIRRNTFEQDAPAVKYRGIFINDEAPAFSGWVREKFGGANHQVYEKIFELLLRMKANYLWPAMWGNAFNDDDTLNNVMADKYGIVMGTSHHEPMLRAQQEWKRYGKGEWNYQTNDSILKPFWQKGIENMGTHESIVTVGMRGDGDKPMTEGTATALLEKIVTDQRKIIEDVTGKPAAQTPQLWALYKEVQDYYDKGMRVPDDITLLLCDDNWGNIRKLPKLTDKPRSGGYGIYYHFDYVGGPRNYKWINTNQVERTWEQMHLAYEYGVDRIWIVNVGDLKPMEFPISFFLDYAWKPERWPAEKLNEYYRQWAESQFGRKHAKEIGSIISKYTKYNSRRKPELLSAETYSLINYGEAEMIVNDYNRLLAEAEKINQLLPPAYKDAYYQLVLHPVQASANLNELYLTVAKNLLYAKQGRAATNTMAQKARELYIKDSLITIYYNTTLSGGKWNHMMDQTHIGYTYWQQPLQNKMPEVKSIELPNTADMGVSVEGTEAWWPQEKKQAILPEFDACQQQTYYIDIFNRGTAPFNYTILPGASWMKISGAKGKIYEEQRILVSLDWPKVPTGIHQVPVTISGPGTSEIIVNTIINKPLLPVTLARQSFAETNKYVSIEAGHFSKAVSTSQIKWKAIPNLGRTLSGITTFPVTSIPASATGKTASLTANPRLEYEVYLLDSGSVKIQAYFSPTLNFHNDEGLKYAISIDDEQPQIITINKDDNNVKIWEGWVGNNIIIKTSAHIIPKPGRHVLKYWMVSPGVVLQKIVMDMGGVKQSYLGPPETKIR